MVFGFLRKLKDGIVNVGKGILGGAKNFIGKVVGAARDKVKQVATNINPEFGEYVDQGFDRVQNFTNRATERFDNYVDRGAEQFDNYADRGQRMVDNYVERGRGMVDRGRGMVRQRIQPILREQYDD